MSTSIQFTNAETPGSALDFDALTILLGAQVLGRAAGFASLIAAVPPVKVPEDAEGMMLDAAMVFALLRLNTEGGLVLSVLFRRGVAPYRVLTVGKMLGGLDPFFAVAFENMMSFFPE